MSNSPQDPTQSPYASPEFTPPTAPTLPTQEQGDATGGVIPYKNVPALLAYYLGLFSLFPLFGLALAIPAFVLGIMGLRKRKQNPAVRGSVHAWIGIVMGGLMTLVWGLCVILILIAIIAG